MLFEDLVLVAAVAGILLLFPHFVGFEGRGGGNERREGEEDENHKQSGQ
jgi:hypothetical protein